MPPDDLPGNLMDFRGSLIGGKIIYEPRSPNQQSLLRILCFLVILNQLRGIFGFENFLRLHWFLMGILSLSLPAGTKRNPVLNSCVDGVFVNQNVFKPPSGTNPWGFKRFKRFPLDRGLSKPPWNKPQGASNNKQTNGAFNGARNGKGLFSRPPRPPPKRLGQNGTCPRFFLPPHSFRILIYLNTRGQLCLWGWGSEKSGAPK